MDGTGGVVAAEVSRSAPPPRRRSETWRQRRDDDAVVRMLRTEGTRFRPCAGAGAARAMTAWTARESRRRVGTVGVGRTPTAPPRAKASTRLALHSELPGGRHTH